MKQYRLRPQHQRRPAAKDGLNRMPICGIEFVGAKVVETQVDLSKWLGIVEEVVSTPESHVESELKNSPDEDVEDDDSIDDSGEDADDDADDETGGDQAGEAESSVLIAPKSRRRTRSIKDRGL